MKSPENNRKLRKTLEDSENPWKTSEIPENYQEIPENSENLEENTCQPRNQLTVDTQLIHLLPALFVIPGMDTDLKHIVKVASFNQAIPEFRRHVG